MAMSLDYLGKFVIILVVIGVAIGMILTFRNQISDTTPDLDDEDPGLEIIKVSGSHSNSVAKVSSLIQLCHQRSLEKSYEDIKCFVARKDSGDFNIGKSELEGSLEPDIRNSTTFEANNYDRGSIIINYKSRPQKVLVKK